MEVKETCSGIEIYKADEFSLKEIFECGQCFRWKEVSKGKFSGIAYGKSLTICEDQNLILLKNTSMDDFQNVWKRYFDLNTDYSQIKKKLFSIHPVLAEATKYSKGIRILRQEPWEALCSFIISQNNNIPRIIGIISRLCSNFGPRIGDSEFAFPSAETVSKLDAEDLSVLRAGFRTDYIMDAAKKVALGEVDLEKINEMPIGEARDNLMKIRGVGPKVAECTLLYGFHRLEAFPLDVWMKRAMKVLFRGMTSSDFGDYAGVAQQYIFYYSRMNKELFADEFEM